MKRTLHTSKTTWFLAGKIFNLTELLVFKGILSVHKFFLAAIVALEVQMFDYLYVKLYSTVLMLYGLHELLGLHELN